MPAPFRLAALSVLLAASPAAQTSETGFYVEPVTAPGSIFDAVDVEVSPDGRIFVLAKNGYVRVVLPDGTLLDRPWLDLNAETFNHAERGALGLALHPDFPATPDVFVVYTVDDSPLPRTTRQARAYGRVTRYSADPDDPNRADPASRRVILGRDFHDGVPSCYYHHSIGTIAFGHDGSLFVGSGDGSGAPVAPDVGGQYDECFSEDPEAGVDPAEDIGALRPQSLRSLGGKILRIDPETGEGYPDNPFYTGDPTDTASKVWALGFRNPFRFSVAPLADGETGPGTLYVGDVGQSGWEEINRARGGENFGWPCYEGPESFAPYAAVTAPISCAGPLPGTLTQPYAYWSHDDPDASLPAGAVAYSVTGGIVYTGDAYPEAYRGALFFADYAIEWVRAARLSEDGLQGVAFVGEDFGNLVDLALEPATGELIAADVIENHIVRIRYAGGTTSPPVARATASARTAVVGAEVTFDATASFDPDGGALDYRWTFGDGATAEGPRVTHAYGDVGLYSATVVVTDADGESRASLPVRVGRAAPVVTIESPTRFVVPEDGRVTLRASARDPVDADETFAYAWAVDLVHNDHVHERFFETDRAEGEFVLEPHGGEGETTHYRATVTVTDGEGLTTSATRTLRTPTSLEFDVARAAPLRAVAGGVEVAFPYALRVGRVGLPGLAEVPDALAVEVRREGEWRPVRFPSALPEADGVQVLFVAEVADAVRVLGADTLAVYSRLDPDAVLPGGGESVDVGAPLVIGQAGLGVAGRLVIAGGGAVQRGAYHSVRLLLSGDGAVTARVDGVSGTRARAGAGVVLREDRTLGGADRGVAFLAETDGDLVVWWPADGTPARAAVGTRAETPWLRLRRVGARVHAEVSADGEAWDTVVTLPLQLATSLWAGPAVTAGDLDGVGALAAGWFSGVEVTGAVGYPTATPTGTFAIEGVYPNPSRSRAALILDAGRSGTYQADLVDMLGRVVWTGAPVATTEVRQLLLPLGVADVGAGAYVVRVRHVESGDVTAQAITVAR